MSRTNLTYCGKRAEKGIYVGNYKSIIITLQWWDVELVMVTWLVLDIYTLHFFSLFLPSWGIIITCQNLINQ